MMAEMWLSSCMGPGLGGVREIPLREVFAIKATAILREW